MRILKILLYFQIIIQVIKFVSSIQYNLCVVGGNSGVGSELIYQSLEKNNKVLALCNNNYQIKIPYRGGGLDYKNTHEYISNNNLQIDIYDNFDKYNFKNIVFTTGAKPFQNDYSDALTEYILFNNFKKLKNLNLENIVLISANGVAETLEKSNLGIKIMNNWYLQDVYRAKNAQEKLVKKYKNKNKNKNKKI